MGKRRNVKCRIGCFAYDRRKLNRKLCLIEKAFREVCDILNSKCKCKC